MYISCIFHVVCAPFSALATRELADAKAYSSGIWALEFKVWVILHRKGRQKVPLLNDQANMRPILNGNLCIHSFHLKLKKDPFPFFF